MTPSEIRLKPDPTSGIGLKANPASEIPFEIRLKPDPTGDALTPFAFAAEHLTVTGCGYAVGRECDSTPFLKSRKLRKFMGRQDELAVVAAARAVEAAALPSTLGERSGVYLSVGFIPFERADLDVLVDASILNGAFSMERFSTTAFRTLNPLLTFRCLPNMPAFHVSLNLDIQGPYWVGYPGIGQFYVALEEAAAALAERAIDVALVGGVADQDNFLVQHHFGRIDHPVDPDALRSAAGFIVMERRADAERRGVREKARLVRCDLRYCPADPFGPSDAHEERTSSSGGAALGPASLAVALSTAPAGVLSHSVRSRDRFLASSEWEIA